MSTFIAMILPSSFIRNDFDDMKKKLKADDVSEVYHLVSKIVLNSKRTANNSSAVSIFTAEKLSAALPNRVKT